MSDNERGTLRIHHLGVAVSSLDDALKFYRDALGLTAAQSGSIDR
jgi:catechol 2,3-dioxygenase-like lactoylglutathione lyase family enzyme